MNSSRWVVDDLPSSGFFVHCRLFCDLGPEFMVSYASYQQILDVIESWFTADELKLLLWKRQCECGDCDVCEAWEVHEEDHCNALDIQVKVGTHGVVKFGQLDAFGSKGDGDSQNKVWGLGDLYQAAHFRVHGNYVRVNDADAFQLMWDGEDWIERFETVKFTL